MTEQLHFHFSLSCIGEGNVNPLQCSCLENPRDEGAWWAAVYGVAQSRTWLSDFTFTFHFRVLEKEMATHSSILAWRIPGMAEPGGLPSMGFHRVGQDWSDLAAAVAVFTVTLWSCISISAWSWRMKLRVSGTAGIPSQAIWCQSLYSKNYYVKWCLVHLYTYPQLFFCKCLLFIVYLRNWKRLTGVHTW